MPLQAQEAAAGTTTSGGTESPAPSSQLIHLVLRQHHRRAKTASYLRERPDRFPGQAVVRDRKYGLITVRAPTAATHAADAAPTRGRAGLRLHAAQLPVLAILAAARQHHIRRAALVPPIGRDRRAGGPAQPHELETQPSEDGRRGLPVSETNPSGIGVEG